jgi:eukaryotic-like serine/threonine-protein kinase
MSDAVGWQRVKGVFQAALDRPPEARAAFLDAACRDDLELRREVESLLTCQPQVAGFLATPASLSATADIPVAGPTFTAGARLGPYEIVGAIGSGGMGEVYRARDVRLEREVAVKVLPRDLAGDADRRRRFEQETRAASALNHPNIMAVHDTGAHDGIPFMVTELLEGQPLSDRIAQGAMPVRKVLECGVQAARGLAAAHERGIVHRDLKPSNLFLTAEGQVKILDFGLAKLSPPAGAQSRSGGGSSATTPGVVLGTVGYMSPEQVRGEEADARSDQFSLGCVLYELLSGEAPFRRPSAAQTMAAVLEAEPPALASVNARVPRAVAWIVERCLAKDREDRYRATGDLARDLELALSRLSELSAPAVPAGPRGRRAAAPLAVATLLAAAMAAAAAAGWWWARHDPQPVPVVRYVTHSGRDSSPSAAPRGDTIAFSSSRDGHRRIWLKQLATGSEAPLTGGEDDHPRFSPDGSAVLFARDEAGRISLYHVSAVGGEPRKVVDDALYGDFSPDGQRIAFVRQVSQGGGVASVVGVAGADGSSPRELARLAADTFVESAFQQPRWSPDGRFLAATQSTHQLGQPNLIALLDVESGAVRRLSLPGGTGLMRGGLAWTPAGEIVYAQPESVAGLQTGTSSRIMLLELPTVRTRPLFSSPVHIARVDPAGPGRLVLGATSQHQSLCEITLGAVPNRRWLTRGNGADRQPVYAPGGEWIAFSSNRTGNLDVWEVSRRSGAVRRLTDDKADDSDPGFMPDGRLLWSSNRSGAFEVWLAEADGSGARQITRDGVGAENPVATPDGTWIVYASANPRSRGIMKIRPDGSGASLLVGGGSLIEPEVSPDGRYVAFVADDGAERAALRVVRVSDGASVLFEVPFPRLLPRTGIDQGRCRWLPDGRGLVYVDRESDGRYVVYRQEFAPGADTRGRRRLAALEADMDAESLGVSPDGASLTVSFRQQLFDLMIAEGVPR